MIIGISGKKQHGKNTVATIIQYLLFLHRIKQSGSEPLNKSNVFNYSIFSRWSENERLEYSGWLQKQFAYKLKMMVAILLGCTVDKLEDDEYKNTPLGEDWQRWFWTNYKAPNPDRKISGLYASKEAAEAQKIKDFDGSLKTVPEYFGSYSKIESDILTPRKILQLLGTEGARNVVHPNIWINALMVDYVATIDARQHRFNAEKKEGRWYVPEDVRVPKQYWNMMIDTPEFTWHDVKDSKVKYPNWIVTDVRFPDEAKVIREMGGLLIRVNRPQVESNDTHESEIALDNYQDFDIEIRNALGIDELIVAVKDSLELLGILPV